jgi:predicted dehydrogenase
MSASTEKLSVSRPDPSQKKIRVGIVGCGEVTQIMHQPSLHHLADRYQITALCDVSSRVLESLGKSWNINHLSTDHRDLVSRTDVDAVLVAVPNAFHAEVTLDAIAAGKHVLVEKPMCVTRREADQIVAAQRHSKVLVQVGYMRRYAPAFLEGCQAVRRMKEIKFARVHDFLGANSLIISPTSRVVRDEQLAKSIKQKGRLRDDALLIEALGEKASPALRRAYTVMLGLSSHDLSAMRELIGMPKKVLFAAQRQDGLYLEATFDYGSFVCQFATGLDTIARFDAYLEVFGAERVVRIQFDTPYIRNLPIRLVVTENNGRGGVNHVDLHPSWGDPFVAEWEAFYDHITSQTRPKTDPVDFVKDLDLFAAMAHWMRER